MKSEIIAPELLQKLIVMRKAKSPHDYSNYEISPDGRKQLERSASYIIQNILPRLNPNKTLILSAKFPMAETTAEILQKELQLSNLYSTSLLNARNIDQAKTLLSESSFRNKMSELVSGYSAVIMVTSKLLAPYLHSIICLNKFQREGVELNESDFYDYTTNPRTIFSAINNSIYE